MDMPEELQALLRNLCLDRQEIDTRLAFLDWNPADAARLRQAGDDFTAVHQQFVEQLYEHLGQFATPATLLQGAGVTERLKHSQFDYYQACGRAAMTPTISTTACASAGSTTRLAWS